MKFFFLYFCKYKTKDATRRHYRAKFETFFKAFNSLKRNVANLQDHIADARSAGLEMEGFATLQPYNFVSA